MKSLFVAILVLGLSHSAHAQWYRSACADPKTCDLIDAKELFSDLSPARLAKAKVVNKVHIQSKKTSDQVSIVATRFDNGRTSFQCVDQQNPKNTYSLANGFPFTENEIKGASNREGGLRYGVGAVSAGGAFFAGPVAGGAIFTGALGVLISPSSPELLLRTSLANRDSTFEISTLNSMKTECERVESSLVSQQQYYEQLAFNDKLLTEEQGVTPSMALVLVEKTKKQIHGEYQKSTQSLKVMGGSLVEHAKNKIIAGVDQWAQEVRDYNDSPASRK